MNRFIPTPVRLLAAATAVLLLPGCGRHDDHGHGAEDDHHHGEEPKTAQITVWGERHEVFAEHRLVVADVPARWVTHVTDLKTHEPRREGPVTFVLRQAGGVPVELVEKAPARAGIYEPMLRFPQKGTWEVSLRLPTEEGEKTVALPPVTVYATKHEADHGEAPASPEGISFLKEQQWKVLTKAEPVGRRSLAGRVRVPAVVAARPGGLARVLAPASGVILPPSGGTWPGLGERVEKGRTLALLQPSFSELAARLAEAEAEGVQARLAVEQAELAFKRTQQLAAVEAKSGRELEEADFALRHARARLAGAQALQATYRQATAAPPAGGSTPAAVALVSPIAGVVAEVAPAPAGGQVTAETPLFTVLDASVIQLEARVPETVVGQLGDAQGAGYVVPGEPGGFTDLAGAGGRLVFRGLQVDPATRTVPFLYEVPNAGGRLRIGQWLELHVETGRVQDALAVPEAAIVEEGGQPVAYVQVGGETFQRRELVLGLQDGLWVEVRSGLAAGERVVTRGALAIRLAAASSVIPAHGHAH